jgi:SNF2 family DNA or RNA helicase
LKAEFRWIISGTPITNKLDDLYSILKFLQFEPYNDRKKWLSLKKHHDSGKLLQKVVQTLALRRTKAAKVNGVPIIDLKSCTIVLKRLELANVHRKKYEEIEIACG